MLKKMRNEFGVIFRFWITVLFVASIDSNGGIDKYLIDELVDNATNVETLTYFVIVLATYFAVGYVWRILTRQIKIDVNEMKNELKVTKEEIKA